MPINQSRSNQDFSKFDSMTNEELEEILRLDAQKEEGEESDLEMLLYVMEVLAIRRKNSEDPGKSAEEAFKSFEENYFQAERCNDDPAAEVSKPKQSPRAHKRNIPWLRRVSAVAAILTVVLFSAITAQAMGIDIWDIVVKWTQETFQFGYAGQTEVNEAMPNDDREYTTLQEALDHKAITASLAPRWIPEGYELVQVRVDESPIQLIFVALYKYEDFRIKIQVKQYLDSDPQQIEQSDSLIEEYESNGTVYYLFADYDQLRAVWIVDEYECYISGKMTIEELKIMIDSI